MRLSEAELSDIQIGDRVTSAIGNPGTIAQILLEGQPDAFGRTPEGRARLLILWSHQKWSHIDHEMAGEIEMGDIPRAHYATGESPDGKWIVIDGSGGLSSEKALAVIRQDIDRNWSGAMQVRIVTSDDGETSRIAWSGTVRDLDDSVTISGGTDALGTAIEEIVPSTATVIVYTDGWVVDRERFFGALTGRPHQLIVMTPGTRPSAHTPPELRLRRRDVRFSV